jgi:hypothetical protein
MRADVMKPGGSQTLMRVFLDKFQKVRHRPLYECVVAFARERRMAGATVFEAIEGFGLRGMLLREAAPWKLAGNMEVVVEIVDDTDQIEDFLAAVEPMLSDAVVTLERASVLVCRHRGEARA